MGQEAWHKHQGLLLGDPAGPVSSPSIPQGFRLKSSSPGKTFHEPHSAFGIINEAAEGFRLKGLKSI